MLHYAAEKGHTATVELLLDRKASIDSINKDESTALHYAAVQGHMEIIHMLLEKGADFLQI